MERRRLGRTDLQVSKLCLGTMTFGEQNTEAEGHLQLDTAVDHGVNFIDTAEVYPVPMKPKTQGSTETIIGNWLKARGGRDQLVIATKVAGGGGMAGYLREGRVGPDRRNIELAVEGSLRRLQTDYIDLYQVHWPDRFTNFFGRRGYEHRPGPEDVDLQETLEALDALVKAGKVRHVGLSNETPWGLMQYAKLSETETLARPASVQNPYSLLNRTFEVGLAEVAHREDIGLLAYSPLGFGALTGKYMDGARPEGARMTRFPQYSRYSSPEADDAVEQYVALARAHDLTPAKLALAFVNDRPFLTSNIIGATGQAQLEENLASADVELGAELLEAIEAIHKRRPNPSP